MLFRSSYLIASSDYTLVWDPDIGQILRLTSSAVAGIWSTTRGAIRVRFADTLGMLDPFATHARIARLRARTDIDIEIHAHNDLGLATANTLAALAAGATHASTTVNGLGERAGNAAMEEVVMALRHLDSFQGAECGIDKIGRAHV